MGRIMTDTAGPDEPCTGHSRLVAVVVTHDRLAQVRVTLRALLKAPAHHLAAVVVVDNASTDGTAEWLAALDDPRLDIMCNTRNLGGAGGFERGMRRAITTHAPDWIVLMDDDARPEPDALAHFHGLALDGYDGVAAAVRHPDGAICEMNRPTFNPFWNKRLLIKTVFGGGRGAFHLGPGDFEEPGLRRIDGASFVGFFVRARAVADYGYPDPDLFLYGDDAIYTFGLTKAGYRLGFDPSIRFEHDSTTFRAVNTRITPMWKIYYYYRNLLILYRIATGAWFVPVLFWYLPRWLLALRHYGPDKRLFLRLYGLALWDGLRLRTDRDRARILDIAGE